ncbi:MAG: DUF1592 domain-containing protein [Acidobacteriaceae bacterium]|jgi:hypothetical protein|nr:DUF1592 domain-containing protein [Acidobacteriaceae bacterium]
MLLRGLLLAAGLAGIIGANDAVAPVVRKYCVSCHGAAKPAGDVDLAKLSGDPISRHARTWQKVVEQISLGEMPPQGLPRPSEEERSSLLTAVRADLRKAALDRAGDPGPVVLRRLNNAEYTYTVRDLTGVPSLDPAKEFPADGAAGEGFTNTGNSLVMSPSLVTKYLDAAKQIARHAVLEPAGIRFSSFTSSRDWTDETLREIRAFYANFTEAGGADTVRQQGIDLDRNRGGRLPLEKYLAASLAVRDGLPVATVARRHGLSPKYLASLVAALRGTNPSLLLGPLRQRWATARNADIAPMAAAIGQWQESLWRFSSVGHIGKVNGPKAWMEPVTPLAAEQEFRLKLTPAPPQEEVTLYLAARQVGAGPATVIWNAPRLLIPGREPLPLQQVPNLVDQLRRRRAVVVSSTAAVLTGQPAPDEARAAWETFLGQSRPPSLALLTTRIEKTADFDFIRGWGGGKEPSVLINASEQTVRIPGVMKGRGVAVLPKVTAQAGIAWRSPLAGTVQVNLTLTGVHVGCGNGVTWALELRRGNVRVGLAEAAKAGPATASLAVREDDLLTLVVGPKDGNASCDLTAVDWTIAAANRAWSLAPDVSADPLRANPLGPWAFFSEPVAAPGVGATIPSGSLLARWFTAADPAQRAPLAAQLQQLLEGPAPAGATPDARLRQQLRSLAGPLFSGVTVASKTEPLTVRAPGLLAFPLPADLVADAEFAVSATVPEAAGAVQLEVATTKPSLETGLLPSLTAVQDKGGTWSSNNQALTVARPVVAGAAARTRFAAMFEEYRQLFPASLCYTRIVPVDEVVTMTLFHREDSHLMRLLLSPAEQKHLDALWARLRFASRAPLLTVDAFEQLWQYATQDADPSAFEPLRQPIQDDAALFRRQLVEAEPNHLDAVLRFAGQAYRRPVTPAEEQGLRALYARLRQQELPHDEAIRMTLVRVLTGPAFLYRTEKAPAGPASAPVSAWELASRLSYFLWSSQPDEALRQAAATGVLRTPAGLAAQVRRMLKDPKAARLSTEFGAAWLHLAGFDTLDEKSERHFPEFAALRGPMYEETLRFFTDFFANGRSILSLLDADHTFVNEPLARHYGIAGVAGAAWQRVAGMKARGRGGILGHAATLAKQSGASRTSPILRGNWVAEVLLGDKLPRPPKDVPQLPEDEAGLTLTMRELTEKHTADPRCAGCHRRIDPYGYALERFDAIGRARDKDLGGRPVHTATRLLDGAEIDGLDGLRRYLLTQRKDDFVRQFNRKLLGYALARGLQLSDEPLLDQMQARLAANGYSVETAIASIIESKQFRQIRGRAAAIEEETAP